MYVNQPEYRIVRDTELAAPQASHSDAEMFIADSSQLTRTNQETLWAGGHQPSDVFIAGIMAQIRTEGSPRIKVPGSSVLSDEVKIQTRRIIRPLGWRTVHTCEINWLAQPSVTKR